MKRVLIVPTFNESKNILRLLEQIQKQNIENLTIVVVDDTSPDGTTEIVKSILPKYPNLLLVQRVGGRGRGTAGIVGFDFAVKLNADQIVEMDSDFSHPPEDLPKLFEGLKQADIVVASRLAPGAVDERPFLRKFITYLANIYARFFMDHHSHRSHIRDWTTGYRAYRKVVFERVPPQNLISQGPSVVQEVLWRAMNQGSTAIEIPFHMINRAQGKSSFNSKVAKQSIFSIIGYWILFRPGDSQVRFYENAPQEFIKVSERFYQIHQKKV